MRVYLYQDVVLSSPCHHHGLGLVKVERDSDQLSYFPVLSLVLLHQFLLDQVQYVGNAHVVGQRRTDVGCAHSVQKTEKGSRLCLCPCSEMSLN